MTKKPVIGPATCPPGFTVPGTGAHGLNTRFWQSGAEMWRALVEGTDAYWRAARDRGATVGDVSRDMVSWYQLATQRQRPTWASPHRVAFETPIARLRDFTEPGVRPDDVVPTLVLPPQAGHDSCIVDYSSEQSQMKVIKAAGLTRACSFDWIGATQATKDVGITDYLDVVERGVREIGGPVNLVGDCQGGWLAAIYAALRPGDVNTLTLAGAPIDFHAGDAVIGDWVQALGTTGDLSFYEWAVGMGGGVLKGEFILNGFIGIKPEGELEKQLQLLVHLHKPDHVERYQAFENWFKHTQDLSGAFYLWIVEHLFRDNKLIHGTLDIEGQRVDLARISCPLFLLAGAEDHITPPAQVFAMADAVSTPAADVHKRSTSGGHLGLFMGREALRDHWPPIMAKVLDHSSAGADVCRAERRARSRIPRARRSIPAP
jgi:poly(3-hydroxyalkanoate) synthetase